MHTIIAYNIQIKVLEKKSVKSHCIHHKLRKIISYYHSLFILGHEQMLNFDIRTFSNFQFQMFKCLTPTH